MRAGEEVLEVARKSIINDLVDAGLITPETAAELAADPTLHLIAGRDIEPADAVADLIPGRRKSECDARCALLNDLLARLRRLEILPPP